MLILNLRTVSFIASLSTTIQSIIWLIGYILYMLTYGCIYQYYLHISDNSDVYYNPSFYFLLYFGGSSCVCKSCDISKWITDKRNHSADLLVGLISGGLVLNIALLAVSIYILIGLNNNDNVRLYISRIKYFCIAVYAVSFWDLVLLGVVSSDIAPLLNRSLYKDGYVLKYKPNTIVLPYMVVVAIITFMILSRFGFIWFCNVVFSTYMLFKKSGEIGQPPPLPPSTYPDVDNKMSNYYWGQNNSATPQEPDQLFSKNNGLPRRIVPPPPPDEPPRDEVPKRWQQYDGKISEDDRFSHNWRNTSFQKDNRFDKGNWSAAEMHIRSSLQKWRNPSIRGLSRESINQSSIESKAPVLEPKRPSLLKTLRNSFRRSPEEKRVPVVPKTPEALPGGVSKNRFEGFNYTENVENPFNMKLRHISRPSLSEESSKKTQENSGSSNEELFYEVSEIDPDDLYEPGKRVPPVPKEPAPLYSSTLDTQISNTTSPPLPPPINASNSIAIRPQISLDEALKTRGPLRPVKRPAIDTSC